MVTVLAHGSVCNVLLTLGSQTGAYGLDGSGGAAEAADPRHAVGQGPAAAPAERHAGGSARSDAKASAGTLPERGGCRTGEIPLFIKLHAFTTDCIWPFSSGFNPVGLGGSGQRSRSPPGEEPAGRPRLHGRSQGAPEKVNGAGGRAPPEAR